MSRTAINDRARDAGDVMSLNGSSTPNHDNAEKTLEERLNNVPDSLRDIFLHPVVAWAITLSLLGICTWWIAWLRSLSGVNHNITIMYLIPVAVAAAFLGVRGGIIATVTVLLLTRIFLLNGDHRPAISTLFVLPNIDQGTELLSLAMGTLVVAAVTGRLRSTLVELRGSNARLGMANENLAAANLQLIASEEMRREFNRDVLLAVTGGKLQLVDSDQLPGPRLRDVAAALDWELKEAVDATTFRQALHALAQHHETDPERTGDLITATTEAATNAIKHGRGGSATVWITNDGIWVLITDRGDGIAPTHLARATLEKGYSTRISLGMGFHMMLESCDALSLATGDKGTSVLLYISNCPRGSESDQILARYLKPAELA